MVEYISPCPATVLRYIQRYFCAVVYFCCPCEVVKSVPLQPVIIIHSCPHTLGILHQAYFKNFKYILFLMLLRLILFHAGLLLVWPSCGTATFIRANDFKTRFCKKLIFLNALIYRLFFN